MIALRGELAERVELRERERGSRPVDLISGTLARLLLAAGSGALLYLSFPPRTLWWLAPLAFVGLGLVLHRRRARCGFGYGLVFGMVFNLAHLVWIQDFLGADFGPAPWVVLSVLMALFIAVACAAMTMVARLPGAPVWMAALYLGQEFIRSVWPFNGFPWGRVAFSQPQGVYTSLASIGGAPLVGFAVLMTGFGLAGLLLRSGSTRPRSWPFALAFLLPVLAGLAVWPTVSTAATSGTVTVAVVQGNAPSTGLGLLGERDKLRRNHLVESDRLLERIEKGEVARPNLVVWPETATELEGADPAIDKLVSGLAAPALIGALYQLPDGRTENAVVAWDPRRGQGLRYAKQELVPFGEYVPMRSIARWFTPFVDDAADMRPGANPGVLDASGIKVGIAVCYEVAYD